MNKLLKLLVLTLAVFMVNACTDLEENLRGDITTDINLEGISVGGGGGGGGPLTGAFSELRNTGTANHFGYYTIQELPSDEMLIAAKGGDWFDGGVLIEMHAHTYTPANGIINSAWGSSYGAINTCNELLAGGTLDDNQKAQITTLRAFFYWRLMDLYGNVKLITQPGSDAPQSNRADVFAFVESELLSALGISEVAPGMDLSASALGEDVNAYRINRFAAMGILAKVYLNAEVYTGTARYGEAAMAAGYVIDSGVYSLCGAGCSVPNLGRRPSVASDPENLEGFAAVFAPNNEGNPENIFTVEYDEATAGGMNFAMMSLHYSSQFTWNFDSQPWNGYATLEEFYNSFDANDARRGASFIVGEQLDFGGSAVLDYATDDGDPVLNYTPAINEIVPNSLREAGARPGKFSYKLLGRADMDNDYPIVRLGDLYLIRAEGLARAAGDWSLALPDANVIRARAGVAAFGSLTADQFLAERGREMFQEASRRTDQIRFGTYNDSWWEKPVSDSHVNIFPIPTEQLNASNGTLTQNPGY